MNKIDREAIAEEKTSRRVWQSPVMEELEVAATEAQYGVPGTAEFGLYTN